jgi:hypothetical protein
MTSDELPRVLLGWGTVYVVLLVVAEASPGTAPLAVAFAWLVVTSLLFAVGPEFWQSLTAKINAGSLTAPSSTGTQKGTA